MRSRSGGNPRPSHRCALWGVDDGVEFDADAPVSLDASPPPTDGTPPVEPDAAAVSDAAAVPENEFRFRVLRPEELQLTSQYRVLARLPAYHPLVHGGWVQLGLPESATIPVDLGVLGVTNPAGTVRLSLTRFLHVKLDLTYVDTQAVQRGPAAAPDDLTELPIAPRYHIGDERTTRSGEIHYFDHPAFGVLIKVTPVKPDPAGDGRPAAAQRRANLRPMYPRGRRRGAEVSAVAPVSCSCVLAAPRRSASACVTTPSASS